MSVTLRPLGARVILRPLARPTQTASGLHLSEHWKPEEQGYIVAVGPKVKEVKPGDFVQFSWSAGQEFFVNDGEDRLFVMNETDISAVLETA